MEFLSSNLPWLNKNAANIKFVKARDDNKILIEDIAKMVDQNPKTKTVVTSHVQYSSGSRQDLKELGRLTKPKGLYFVANPTQSLETKSKKTNQVARRVESGPKQGISI